MEIRSPSPVFGEGGGLPGLEDIEETAEEEWPPEHASFDSHRVSFWELGPIPVGSVITFLQDPEEEGLIPAIIAVVVTGSEPKNSEGVQILVKFLGSDQAWGKTWAVSQFSRKKRGIHICKGGELCLRSDAVHLTEFGFWLPGTFQGDYVEKKNMRDYEKFVRSLQDSEALEKETLEPDKAEEKLGQLRKRLLQARGQAAPSSRKSVSFAPLPPKAGILKRRKPPPSVKAEDSEALEAR